jgi:cellulose synthase (UDP-forming)
VGSRAPVIGPYAGLALVSGLTTIVFSDAQNASGFYVFAILNCAVYVTLLGVMLMRHAIENDLTWWPHPTLPELARYAACASVLSLPVVDMATRGLAAIDGITGGSDTIRKTSTTKSASGAGQRGDRIKPIRFVLFERACASGKGDA